MARRTARRLPRKLIGLLAGVGLVGAAVYFGRDSLWGDTKLADEPLTAVAHRSTLRVVVTERGNLESTVTVDGVCELNGHQNKIIELVAEGTKVEKGQIVCRFDASEIEKNIAQQQIKAKQAKSKIETTSQELEIARSDAETEEVKAGGELKVAQLTKKMFEKGTNPADIAEAESKIRTAKKELEKATDQVESISGLVKKGFKSPSDLRQAEAARDQYQFQLESEQRKLQVKREYEKEKTEVENQSKVDQAEKSVKKALAGGRAKIAKARSEVDSAEATYVIEDQQLQEFLKQKSLATIKAERSGILAYANEPWYDSSRQIREGATVYSRQKIFSIPDLTSMRVKVNIHESFIKKVKAGQKAEIRVDAFPNLILSGTVKSVSNLADSERGWLNGGVKEYGTTVDVSGKPEEGLKPGMTAEVKILIQEIKNALVVPIQAVADHKGEFFAFVSGPNGYEPRKVKVGETDEKFVEITDGLKDGDRVAIDARSRAAAYFKEDEKEGSPASKSESKPAAAPPSP